MSYVSLAEAEELISMYFLSTSSARSYWDKLDEADKWVCLRNAFRAIEQLPLTGKQTDPNQENAFPRWPFVEVPQEVRDAQVLVAVNFADPTAEAERERYRRLRVAGVSSYSIGKFSETFKASDSSGYGLVSLEALNLLKPWLAGGYRIV